MCGLEIPGEELVVKRLRMRFDRRIFRAMCLFGLDLMNMARKQEEEGKVEQVRESSWPGYQV